MQAGAGCRDDGAFTLSIHEGLVSLNSENACLGAILAELGERGKIKIHVPQSLAEIPLSASFQKLPLREGISRMLKDTSYALQTETVAGSSGEAPFLGHERIEIWLLPRSSTSVAQIQSDHSKLLPDEAQHDAADLAALAEYARSLPKPEMRAYAIQLMAQTDDVASVTQMLSRDLLDPDPEIRSNALNAMIDLDPAVAASIDHWVANIALYDKNTELRKRALLKLAAEDFPAETTAFVVKEAMHDEDPEIKKLAEELSMGLRQPSQ